MKRDLKGSIALLDKFIYQNRAKLDDLQILKNLVILDTYKELQAFNKELLINFEQGKKRE